MISCNIHSTDVRKINSIEFSKWVDNNYPEYKQMFNDLYPNSLQICIAESPYGTVWFEDCGPKGFTGQKKSRIEDHQGVYILNDKFVKININLISEV